MGLNTFNEFVYIILVNASQTASHEEAQVTHALLSNLSVFYKHMIRDDENALLAEEVHALQHYLQIQKARYGKRFDTSIYNIHNADIFVQHFKIISFVDDTLNHLLSRYECFFRANITFAIKDNKILLDMTVDIEGKKEVYRKSFTKRGGRLCTNS